MSSHDLRNLLLLAAIWGSSFLFTRLAAFDFGAFPLILVRVGAAGLMLLIVMALQGRLHALWPYWRPIAMVGFLNAAVPFTCYAFAATRIEIGLLSVLNAMTPLFAALIARLWLKEQLSGLRVLGLVIGFLGIITLVYDKLHFDQGATGWAILASLVATLFYGIAASFSTKYLKGAEPIAVAAGSLSSAGIMLAPFAWWLWPDTSISAGAWGSALTLSLLCTGLAYLIFYRLLANVGGAKTVTVTFLVPPFGVLWGVLLLGEKLSFQVVGGTAVVLLGTLLATGFIGGRGARA
ncbi:DMT family transporter [Paenalcaligenes niemegkensis]|uniref:DMT family transporter n=1 Tax=Paenalcaligenes niemegkensis TaxID=2895469 RepID=UPI001EE7BBA4|nr:EamA family transporter [Paenalcaligenes niemegkensis]MCQ9618182.1 DMT family transporter [Paenalcaligenes niemegkensis]